MKSMKKYELLLYYLDLKISILCEQNLDEYDKYIRQGGVKDEDYQYVKGTYMGFDNAMRLICELLDEFMEGDE